MDEMIDLLKKQEQVLTDLVNKLMTELQEVRKEIVMKTIKIKIKE